MERQWLAIYTQPRSEKKVSQRLKEKGITTFCPTVTTVRQWSDRKKKVEVPLFSSYVFVQVTELERNIVLQDQGVASFVFWLGKPAIIRESEINAIKKMLSDYPEANFEIKHLEKGDKIEVKTGAFKGSTGVVKDIKKKTVTLEIEALGIVLKAVVSKGDLL